MQDPKRDEHEEEYQFPGDEYLPKSADESHEEYAHFEEVEPEHPSYQKEEEAEIAKKQKRSVGESFAKHKRLVAVLGIIVVTLIIFQLMRPHHQTTIIETQNGTVPGIQTPKSAQVKAVKPTVTKPTETQPSAATAATATSPVATTTAPVPVNIGNLAGGEGSSMEELKSAVDASHQEIQQLQTQVQNLTTTLEASQTLQKELQQNIQTLNDQLMQAKFNNAVKEIPVRRGSIHHEIHKALLVRRVYSPPLVYHLRAVEPGRAWLTTSHGKARSVAVGDRLKGYGIVQAIDSQQGLVYTSSNRLIQFPQED